MIDFVRHVSDTCVVIASRFSRHHSLTPILPFSWFVRRRAALRALPDAYAALLLLGAGPRMGHPPSEARNILNRLSWGVVADPDAADTERGIESLVAMLPPARTADPEGRYDVALAGRLAAVLREAADFTDGVHG